MVHYRRLNVHDKRIRVATPGRSRERHNRRAGWLSLSGYFHTSFIVLFVNDRDYRFAKLTFLWWNNGVEGTDEEGRGHEKRTRTRRGGEERGNARQFDLNRSIVIRVNRLSSTANRLPNTIRDLYCCTLFPRVCPRRKAAATSRECLRLLIAA